MSWVVYSFLSFFRWGEFWLFLKFLWLVCLCIDLFMLNEIIFVSSVKRVFTFIEHFSHSLREADEHIDELIHTLGAMHRWSVVVFSNCLWNIPTPVDQVMGGCVIQRTSKSTHCAGSGGRTNSIQGSTTLTRTIPSTATLVWKSRMESWIVLCCLPWWD